MSNPTDSSIGQLLRDLRIAKGYTLRFVEGKTGISNAYLSQLEHDQIEKPSPHVLYKLATFYEVDYDYLMQKAGYYVQTANSRPRSNSRRGARLFAASAISDLSTEEEEELLKYLGYIRTHRRRRRA